MNRYSLIASVTLMRELYTTNKNNALRDILAEFINNIVVFQDKNIFTVEEIQSLLLEIYGFEIPKLIITSTIKKSLREKYSKENGKYTFLKKNKDKFQIKLDKISTDCTNILNSLYEFIEIQDTQVKVYEKKEEIKKEFFNFLLGEQLVSDQYYKLISKFILLNKKNKEFENVLNLIREGVIIYQGITYTNDLNSISSWNENLTIFLGTEHLFNAMNYNDKVYKDIFNDFYNLVKEINLKNSRKRNNKKKEIKLRYFSETKEEIQNYFKTAENIYNKKVIPDFRRPAMLTILEGITDISEIKMKEFDFFK